MKCKDYLEKYEKVLSPLDELTPQLNILALINLLASEIGGNFKRRVDEFIEKEKEIILNSEIKEVKL